MNNSIVAELAQYKDRIPEFVVKLYHILQSKQYADYICWAKDNEILIKHGKKLQEKVLPNYFRHRHLSSFIRQLNMYKFNKVNQVIKEKNYMYFKNSHFKRGNITAMLNIKRNHKKNNNKEEEKSNEQIDNQSDMDRSDMLSINKALQNNTSLESYKSYVKVNLKEVMEIIKKIEKNYPQAKPEFIQVHHLCNEILENQQSTTFSQMNLEQSNPNHNNKNMLSTMRLLPRLESLIFPSQCSFIHLN